MHASPAVEDYLAAIYDLTSSGRPVIGARLAKHMKLPPPAVTEALSRMLFLLAIVEVREIP